MKLIPIDLNNDLLKTAREQRFLTGILIFYIVSIFWGSYRYYSPVPVSDMWEGYVGFYSDLLKGNSELWWSQHNEHRPVLARILFYIDLHWLGGKSLLLIPVNVLLMMTSWYMILLYARNFLQEKLEVRSFYFLIVLLSVFALSWKQDENVVWAFQSQFWFAFLIPLLAFYFMAQSEIQKDHELKYISLASLFGVLSVISMANGLLALPMLTVMAIALRKRTVISVFLAMLSIVFAYLYLADFHTPSEHKSLIENITTMPWQTIVFFVEYVGSPPKSFYISLIFGSLHLYLIYVILRHLKQNLNNPLYLSAVAFMLYFLATAMATSGGRVNMGFKAALMGRYTTPAIISFTLSLILYLYLRPDHIRYISKRLVIIVAVIMLGTQARTFIKNVDKIHDIRAYESMMMELNTFPLKKLQLAANKGVINNISIFRQEPYRDKRELLGNMVNTSACRSLIYTDAQQKRGGLYQINEEIPSTEAITVTDNENKIIGFGVPSKQFRNGVLVINGPEGNKSGQPIKLYRCKQ